MTSEQCLTLFDMAFLNHQLWEEGGMRATHHNFVVIASMVTKFTTDIKLDCTLHNGKRRLVMLLLLRNYNVITCILAYAYA